MHADFVFRKKDLSFPSGEVVAHATTCHRRSMDRNFQESHFCQLSIAVALVSEFCNLQSLRRNRLRSGSSPRSTGKTVRGEALRVAGHDPKRGRPNRNADHARKEALVLPTVISRFISKIRGIKTTMEVDARNNPTVPPFCASQYDHSLETLKPC
ncbi:unnamed protein product [Pseudo-nitzschia multistriata]|uniref:Uncharacterized protein n=1 Tax=Pseudo-nitzschia multistriata TaxID=183589 RepID=A0A448YZF9_9STRA|nr:unnamed protein product [Pseudo-nitzschia multistriata]